jgi:hypothetical protein
MARHDTNGRQDAVPSPTNENSPTFELSSTQKYASTAVTNLSFVDNCTIVESELHRDYDTTFPTANPCLSDNVSDRENSEQEYSRGALRGSLQIAGNGTPIQRDYESACALTSALVFAFVAQSGRPSPLLR